MDFEPSPSAALWSARVEAFSQRYLLPHNAAWQRCAAKGDQPQFMEDLQSLARAEASNNPLLQA